MNWPILKKYPQDKTRRIALPIGGIGTGTVSLGGRGDLRDWEIVNRPAKKFNPEGQGINPFFAICAIDPKGKSYSRILEGPVDLEYYEGQSGAIAKNHGFPRFRNCEFKAAYPFGQVALSDKEMPVKATLKAFNPLIPADSENSSFPAAVIRIEVKNTSKKKLKTGICFSMPNFIGEDGSIKIKHSEKKKNKNVLKKNKDLTGIYMTSPNLSADVEQFGNMFVSTFSDQELTYRTGWADLSWGGSKLDFWDDFIEDCKIDKRKSKHNKPIASLCINNDLKPGETKEITFFLTWHFPNRKNWAGDEIIGNYYTTRFKDSVTAALELNEKLDDIEKKSIEFVKTLCSSSLPESVIEAALFNLSTLRTQTCFQTPDGKFYGWEGCGDNKGCCEGSCTHVWNYENATGFLFGDLAKTMREIEFKHATNDEGHMAFRVVLPLKKAEDHCSCEKVAAADGQMGSIMRLYREWQLSGDDEMLKDLYPKAKKAMEFCWKKGGWDGDRDGLMEGCQHNTMDVEYYGPNPQMGFWYLGALRAIQEMALYMEDAKFAIKCASLFEKGSKALDKRLFNGDYYEHIIEPAKLAKNIAPGLSANMGSANLKNPVLQLGAGCLVDQLVGQYTVHVLGLGYLADKKKIKKTLKSIMKYNFKKGFHDHFNHMRSYVLGDESALLMATYPKGRRPVRPFPYYNEVMTGFEYTAAVHMLYEGQVDEGLKVIDAIRARYDGNKRSPFDEAECGHHYARAMASWAALLALTGFHYSGVEKKMTFANKKGTHFWSTGYAWGTCKINKEKVNLKVQFGEIELKEFRLGGKTVKQWDTVKTVKAGSSIKI